MFDNSSCTVVVQMTPGANGITLAMPAGTPTVVATYTFQGVTVATTLQDGALHFTTAALESLRASGVGQIDLVLAASQSQYLRARLELPEASDKVIVYIE